MALKAGYKGIKKIGPGLKLTTEGTLSLSDSGETGLNDLDDVDISTPAEGDILSYDATNEKWINSDPLSAKVDKTDIAPVETGTTASRAYAVGQQFYLSDGKLYKCKQPIAQGATFTIGTNCELAPSVTDSMGGYIDVDLRNTAVTTLDNLTGYYYGSLTVECPTNAVPYGWCWVSTWETFGVSVTAQDSTHIKIGLLAKQSCTFPNPTYPKYIRIFYKIM